MGGYYDPYVIIRGPITAGGAAVVAVAEADTVTERVVPPVAIAVPQKIEKIFVFLPPNTGQENCPVFLLEHN